MKNQETSYVGAASESRRYSGVIVNDLPVTGWHIKVHLPMQRFAPPVLLVSIDESVQWPGGADSDVYYRVNLTLGDGTVAKDVGRLTSAERFSAIVVIPHEFVPPASEEFETDLLFDNGENLIVGAFAEATVQLVAYEDDLELHDDKAKKVPDQPKYTWGQTITEGPYKGKTPEQAAGEIIDKQVSAICAAKDPNGQPAFPAACAKLTALRAKTPKEPKVECMLKGAAGTTSPLDGTIMLDGDDLLNDDHPAEVLLHECSHALDVDAGLTAAAIAVDAAKKAGQTPPNSTVIDAIIEKLNTELKAPFVILDHGTFFDYPGKGLSFIKGVIKKQITELAQLRARFDGAVNAVPRLKQAFKDTFKKIQAKLNDPAHADVLRNLKQDKVKDTSDSPTFTEVLDKLAEGDSVLQK